MAKMTEGQMDFLGLLSEYTDQQGATVRVRQPAVKRVKAKLPERTPDPEQLTLHFEDEFIEDISEFRTSEAAKKQAADELYAESERLKREAMRETEEAAGKEAEEAERRRKAEEAAKLAEAEAEAKRKAEEEKRAEEARLKAEAEAKAKEAEDKLKAEKKRLKAEEEAAVQNAAENGSTAATEDSGSAPEREMLFKQCKNCWCFTCRHNSRNEAVPREMCGTMMACPACKSCEEEDCATICEIGNAAEGCRLRAAEEGLYIPDEA